MKLSISLLALSVALLSAINPAMAAIDTTATATFAGGCFWSMQHDFDKLPGVVSTVVGYTGGHVPNPSYDQVSTGETGHYEAIQVTYDPAKISYAQLVDFYWHDIDPGDATGQFCDDGNEYHSVIFYRNDAQHQTALASKAALEATHRFPQVVTVIEPEKPFYRAEEYHQKYAEKNPLAYAAYRTGCRRDARTAEIWGK